MELKNDIPEALLEPVEAARNWLNTSQGTNFEVTGLSGHENALNKGPEESFEIGVIFCDGKICKREKIHFIPNEGNYRFSIGQPDFEMPAELDPPLGLRKGWLEKKLGEQAFLLLLFYRGRW